MNIEWDNSFPALGPGLTGTVYDVAPGTVVSVSMTIIVPPELAGANLEWWQEYVGDGYSAGLDVGENNLNFQVAVGPNGDWGMLRALVFYGGATDGVVVEIPAEPVITVPGEPVANDDESETTEGSAVVTDVLANDTIDGEPVTLESVTLPTIVRHPEFGTVEVLPNGSIRYTPEPGFVGEDSYEYEIEAIGPECYEIYSDNAIFVSIDDLGEIPGFAWGETESFGISDGSVTYWFSYDSESDSYAFSSDSEYPGCGNLGSGTMTFGDAEVCISSWENRCS